MRLTDAHLRTLLASDPSNADIRRKLAQSNCRMIRRLIPARTGTWRGQKVILDEKGAMASGYWCYFNGLGGYPPTDTWNEIVRDPPTPRTAALEAEYRRQLALTR